MPSYDYKCQSCGNVTEKILSYDDSYKKQWCKRLNLGTGSYCGGELIRQFPMPRAFLHVIESRSTVKKLKSEGKFIAGDAKLHEIERYWNKAEQEADERLDRQAKKWAEACVEELGESGLYTSENQQRGDTVPLPVPDGAKEAILGNPR